MATLLLVDDDTEVLEINGKFLASSGYNVYTASTPMRGLALAKSKNPDCIVLDVMMPGMSGYELCAEIRKTSNVPIIFLTGKSSEDNKIQGLVTGADDYMVKPYSLKELKTRIDVILRRINTMATPSQDSHQLKFGNLTIDMLAHKAYYCDEDLQLANREYEVLIYLAEHPNRDITFEELGKALFGSYEELDRRSVMVNVSRLRKKMNLDSELENMIETVWSKGYRFQVKQ